MGDSVFLKIMVRMASWGNNEWKKNAFVMNFDHACQTLMTHGKSIRDFVYSANHKRCPLPKVRGQT